MQKYVKHGLLDYEVKVNGCVVDTYIFMTGLSGIFVGNVANVANYDEKSNSKAYLGYAATSVLAIQGIYFILCCN